MALLQRLLGGTAAEQRSNEANESARGGDNQPPSEPVSKGDLLRQIEAFGKAQRFSEAHQLASRGLEWTPDDPDFLFAKATALLDGGRHAEARDIYERLERAGRASNGLSVQLAMACHRLGDEPAAEGALRRAIERDPVGFEPRYALGALLQSSGHSAEARTQLDAAVAANPSHLDAQIVLGNILMDLAEYTAAEVHYRRAASLASESPAAATNVGFSLARQDRHQEALEAFRTAYDLERAYGGDTDAFWNFAVALADASQTPDAIAVFESNLPSRPAPHAHWNYAVALLRGGRLAEGWCQHEFRSLLEASASTRPDYGVPMWTGQPLAGKTIVVRAEQGLGDTIQMLRYVPSLAARGARVLLRSPPGFDVLGSGVEGLAEVLKDGTPNPPFDYWVPAMSLPGIFGTTLESIPADVPYIDVDAARRDRWRARLGPTTKRRVGLAWAGSPIHLKDRYRSITLAALRPLFSVADIEWVSLQKGPASEELARTPEAAMVRNLGPELDDLADAAAVIQNLDLLVSVDTALVHLAGALACPTWALIASPNDWRWLEGRSDSPWYPTVRLYRQERRGDWEGVVARVRDDLAAWVHEPSPGRQHTARPGPNIAALSQAVERPPCTVAAPGIARVAETRWGVVQFVDDPPGLADALPWYGEWLAPHIRLLRSLLRTGSVIVEVGAGVGAHVLALASIVGDAGRVYACERRPVMRRLLAQNVAANRRANVVVALNDPACASAPSETVDTMGLERLDLIKCSASVDAKAVLAGASEVLWRTRPIVLAEVSDSDELTGAAQSMEQFGYQCWRMETPLFDPDNFNRRENDVFEGRSALALLALPEETEVANDLPGCTKLT